MNLIYVLITGCIVWLVSEVLEFRAGGFDDTNSVVTALAFGLVAIGIWAIWNARDQRNYGRAGVALISLGMILFTILTILTIGTGITSDIEHADSPLFLSAGAAVSAGVIALSSWIFQISHLPKWSGVVLLVGTMTARAGAFMPSLIVLQGISSVCLAVALIWISLALMKAKKN